MEKKYLLEVIGFTAEGYLKAQDAGAHRIELCDNPGEGGTTPSYGFIKTARKQLHIDLFPMIRPRGGDFLYSKEEFEMMKTDIAVCSDQGCEGVVFGILLKDGNVDTVRCQELVELAYPMETTFHRAFDRVKDPVKALEDIINCGFTRILTSGLKPTAPEGKLLIRQLTEQADERIIIMPGSGVRSDTLEDLMLETGALEFHSSARMNNISTMEYSNPQIPESLNSISTDEKEIKKMLEIFGRYKS